MNRSNISGQHSEDRSGYIVLNLFPETDDVEAIAQPRRRCDDRRHFVEDTAGLKTGASDCVAFTARLAFRPGKMGKGQTARKLAPAHLSRPESEPREIGKANG